MAKRVIVEHGFSRKSEFEADQAELIGPTLVLHNNHKLVAAFNEWSSVIVEPADTQQLMFPFMEGSEHDCN